MADESQDFDLATLNDDELAEQMHNDLYDGMADAITEGTNILLGRGWSPEKVLNDALVEGMRIVGIDFRDGILFVPEVLVARDNVISGSVDYVAPEVLTRKVARGEGPLVDLYALGALAYELLTNKTPFPASWITFP